MRTWWRMVVIFGYARRQLYDYTVFPHSLLLFDSLGEIAELAVYCQTATAATRQIEHAVVLVLRIHGKAADAFIERSFTVIAGAALFHNMALYYGNVVLVLQVYHSMSFLPHFEEV